jgi:hypothetical protein
MDACPACGAVLPPAAVWSPDGLDDVDGLVARLDALVLLGRRTDIEEEARRWSSREPTSSRSLFEP